MSRSICKRLWPLTPHPPTGSVFWDEFYRRAHESFVEDLALRLTLFGPLIAWPVICWMLR